MIWDDTEPYHGFTKGKKSYLPFDPENTVSAKQAMRDENSLYHFICKLISLRKTIKDLKDPHVEIQEKNRVFLFERGKYVLIANMSKKAYSFEGEKIISSREFEGKLPSGCAVLIKTE